MNIETVNELIQSLESAGELSIKERKYLELAKAYVQLAAENALRQEFVKICFRAAADGASMDGADIQEIGGRLGLFVRETYQPVLHSYICGHEAGEDSVYVMKGSPATSDYLAGIKADGVEEFIGRLQQHVDEGDFVGDEVAVIVGAIDCGKEFSEQLREASK